MAKRELQSAKHKVDDILRKETSIFLPEEIFWQRRSEMPRFCLDCIVRGNEGILLGLRTSWPMKDTLGFFGGGVLLGDERSFRPLLMDKIKSETGLVVAVQRPVGIYSIIFERGNDDEHGKKGSVVHDICMPFTANIISGALKMDSQHSKFVWINKVDDAMHQYVKEALMDTGLFDRKGIYIKNGRQHLGFAVRTILSL